MAGSDKQHLPELIDTVFAASDMLAERDLTSHLITRREASTMSAISHLLIVQSYFHPNEIAEMTEVLPGNARKMVHKFEVSYELLEGCFELSESRAKGLSDRGRHQRHYVATEFGHQVFALFQTATNIS